MFSSISETSDALLDANLISIAFLFTVCHSCLSVGLTLEAMREWDYKHIDWNIHSYQASKATPFDFVTTKKHTVPNDRDLLLFIMVVYALVPYGSGLPYSRRDKDVEAVLNAAAYFTPSEYNLKISSPHL